MQLEQRINAFSKLGIALKNLEQNKLDQWIVSAKHHNPWFTKENILFTLENLAAMLDKKKLEKWTNDYGFNNVESQNIGLILAGNIPFVGFHDILCTLISGHSAWIKPGSADNVLIQNIVDLLLEIEPAFAGQIKFVDKVKGVDAVVATGSDNTARYFEYYFSSIPHIIRKNRTSVAVLSGEESPEKLKGLGKDIFTYFGLGCRNVSKLYVPESYHLDSFFEAIFDYGFVADHQKYRNNYDYNRAIYLLNSQKHFDNNFLILKEDKGLGSPAAVVFYEHYKSMEDVARSLNAYSDKVQVVVSDIQSLEGAIGFGQTQSPELWDYADKVDTMEFLLNL